VTKSQLTEPSGECLWQFWTVSEPVTTKTHRRLGNFMQRSPKIAQELSKPLAIDFTTIERRPKTGIHMESRKRLHLLLWIVAVLLLDASGPSGSTGAVGGVAPSSGAGGTPAEGQPQSSPRRATAQVPAPANPNDAGATNRGGCISGTITNNSGTSTGTASLVGTQEGQGAAANDTSNSITGTSSNTSAGSKPAAMGANGSNQATSSDAMTGQRGC
jgi:hypothetical protein